MKTRNVVILIVSLAILSGSAISWLAIRLQESECARTALQEQLERARASKAEAVPAEPQKPETKRDVPPVKPDALEAGVVEYDGKTRLRIHVSERPDMDVVRSYVSVSPACGSLAVSYSPNDDGYLDVTGNFTFRTNLTLTLRAGLPAERASKAKPLQKDFVYAFRRPDAEPTVRFVASGRYLPPNGRRLLAIESVNVTNVACALSSVLPENIVQLLAREERCYASYYGSADDEETGELADPQKEWSLPAHVAPNKPGVTAFAVSLPGVPTNGVYLARVRSADVPRQDWRCDWDKSRAYNPDRYRLVCVTDLGLTVRRVDTNLQVWVTSLLKGRPVADCAVDVYAANRRLLAKGRTDSRGLALLTCAEGAEPFAVIATRADGSDRSFMALRDRLSLDEIYKEEGDRPDYLKPDELTAFVWTERGIYRHGEPVFIEAVLRNGRGIAPQPTPVEVALLDGDNRVYRRRTVLSDAVGAVRVEDFTVAADAPSGTWTVSVRLPGKDQEEVRVLATRSVSIEEFAPPQIRVKVAAEGTSATNFAFRVSAEHLYGGPARGLLAEGAVVFEDVPFAPAAWKGWCFGNEDLGLTPNFRTLPKGKLDGDGALQFQAPVWADAGKPKAAVRAICQGTVFEDGGRPATARATVDLHYYPYYIGAKIGERVDVLPGKAASFPVVCVTPEGVHLAAARRLAVRFVRVDTVYSCKRSDAGWDTWHCDRVRVPVGGEMALEVPPAGEARVTIPFTTAGDYVVTLEDKATGVSFARAFWLGEADEAVRAPLANPALVTLKPDKVFYRPGETPRLLVRAPFTGWGFLTVMREKPVYTAVIPVTKATMQLTLPAAVAAWAPSVDVSLSLVQAVQAGERHQAARSHGQTVVKVRCPENEIPVRVTAEATPCMPGGGSRVVAEVEALGAAATGTVTTVTVVDEGINLLTDEPVPDPIASFAMPRMNAHPVWDIFDALLPVWDGDPLKVRGAHTGGGCGAELLGRVSPVPTRRFKPLARWQKAVPLVAGRARVTFDLPEFMGEVRVTAVAFSARAAGAAAVPCKVVPKLVMQPDAPRFADPGDCFSVTLPLANRSGAAGTVRWSVSASGAVGVTGPASGEVKLEKDASTVVTVACRAGDGMGTGTIAFTGEGWGERHAETIELPVRPGVAAVETAGVRTLQPGERVSLALTGTNLLASATVRRLRACDSQLAELRGALEFLARYPHGCLEQTCSRIFPLIAAGGFLNAVGADETETDRAAIVKAGIRRVESMIRPNHFVMWPDCNYPPWDDEVSLWACHFLVEAERAGETVQPAAKAQILKFLTGWVQETNAVTAAYACHTLALAGKAPRDRMLRLYERRGTLDLLSRARLARAFARAGDRTRAYTLVQAGAEMPRDVREAAFAVLALLDLDPDDARLPGLVTYLTHARRPDRSCWGTTAENAHALLALGAWYRHHPPQPGAPRLVRMADGGEAPLPANSYSAVTGAAPLEVVNRGTGTGYLAWQQLVLPRSEAVTNAAHRLHLSRTYLRADGYPADLANLQRGDLVIARLRLSADVAGRYADLVIQDLFPAAFEPVHAPLDPAVYAWFRSGSHDWVMRSDARDDRMLVFSKAFNLQEGEYVEFYYPLRVVSAGDFILPGPSVEDMYHPAVRAVCAPGRLVVAR